MSFFKHSGPARSGFAITTSDVTNFEREAQGIYVGGTGNVVIVTPDGVELTFNNAQAGSVIPWAAIRVNATGTTATGLIGGTS
jgi:hypothetical protein